MGLGKPKKALWGLFGLSKPNKDRERSERVPGGFPKGWEGIPADVEGI